MMTRRSTSARSWLTRMAFGVLFCAVASAAHAAPVVWTSPVNVAVNGNTITKTTGGSWTAGAVSSQNSTSGDAYVEFSTLERNKAKVAGLGIGNTDAGYNDVDFGFYLRNDGLMEVRFAGQARGVYGSYQIGDIFRVEYFEGQIRYVHNGNPIAFGTPNLPAGYDLRLDASLAETGATVSAADMGSCVDASGQTPHCIVPGNWENVEGVRAYSSDLIKVGGSSWGTGASSRDSFVGDGYVTFTAKQNTVARMGGLGILDTTRSFSDIANAVYLRADGYVELYEAGTSRGVFGTYMPGDVFQVQLLGNEVRYVQNGAVFHGTHVNSLPQTGYILDTSFSSPNAELVSTGLVECGYVDSLKEGSEMDVTEPLPFETLCIEPGYFTNIRGVRVQGNNLKKVGLGSWAAGVSSYDSIGGAGQSTNGFVEFTTQENNSAKMAGLGKTDAGAGFDDIDHAIYMKADGNLEIYERGQSKGGFGPYQAGMVFKVQVQNNVVSYYKNGTVFYTSGLAPVYPLNFDSSFSTQNATVTNVLVTTLNP